MNRPLAQLAIFATRQALLHNQPQSCHRSPTEDDLPEEQLANTIVIGSSK